MISDHVIHKESESEACGDIFGLAPTSSSFGNFFLHLTKL